MQKASLLLPRDFNQDKFLCKPSPANAICWCQTCTLALQALATSSSAEKYAYAKPRSHQEPSYVPSHNLLIYTLLDGSPTVLHDLFKRDSSEADQKLKDFLALNCCHDTLQ
jgi:hypothetical protein